MHSVKMRPTLTDVARSVCLLVTTVSPNKVVEPIEMTFSMWTHGAHNTYQVGVRIPHKTALLRGHTGTCPAVDIRSESQQNRTRRCDLFTTVTVAICYCYYYYTHQHKAAGKKTIDVKKVQIKFFLKFKNVKSDKNKKNVCKRNKKRYLFLVQFNSTPDAQEMASGVTRNMPFSLVLQKLSSFQASSEIINILLFKVSCILILSLQGGISGHSTCNKKNHRSISLLLF